MDQTPPNSVQKAHTAAPHLYNFHLSFYPFQQLICVLHLSVSSMITWYARYRFLWFTLEHNDLRVTFISRNFTQTKKIARR